MTDESSSDSSYSSSSDSESSVIQKISVSKWTHLDLERLGIFYDGNPIDLDDIYQKLKCYRVRGCKESNTESDSMEPMLKMFITMMKEGVSFSLDSLTEMLEKDSRDFVQLLLREKLKQLDICINNFWTYQRNLQAGGSDRIQEENGLHLSDADLLLFDDIFHVWVAAVFNFQVSVRDLCTKVAKAAEKAAERERTKYAAQRGSVLRESNYTETIVKYTEIFFLSPSCGDSGKTELYIRNKSVGSIPDIRFYKYTHGDLADEVVFLIENWLILKYLCCCS